MQGTIKKIIGSKGYGFISSDEYDDDIFFHRSAAANFDDLREGDLVEFTVEVTFKGPQANDLTRVE